MTTSQAPLHSATRTIEPAQAALLRALKPGERIQITHRVRVGLRQWTMQVQGTFREWNYLQTGLATDRVPEDDILVVAVHFCKDGGELSSITMDENTKLEVLRSK